MSNDQHTCSLSKFTNHTCISSNYSIHSGPLLDHARFTDLIETLLIEPVHEKTNNLCFRPGLIETSLYSHRSRLEDVSRRGIALSM